MSAPYFFLVLLQIVYLPMNWFKKLLFGCKQEEKDEMKYLIVGLGNVGSEYENTRHNCGFMAVDALAKESDARFQLDRHAYRAEIKHKGRTLILIKPTTYMNLSGKAVKYWMMMEKVPIENVLVVVDDIALPVGQLRMKKQGSGGGHNGLGNIEQLLGTNQYCRLRIGVGNDFGRGQQIDYVLGQFTSSELAVLEPQLLKAVEGIKAFCTVGPDRAMNMFNEKKKKADTSTEPNNKD